jgi:lycopene cyclase domain-containing protein
MYLATLLLLAAIALFLEIRFNFHLYRSRKWRLIFNIIFLIVGLSWDAYGAINHWWIYPGPGTLHIFIGVLPIEEFLFYFVAPYFSITVYKLIELKYDH